VLTPAKIASPQAPNAVRRHRLFVRLDEAAQTPVTWVHSPAGSGKTTLIASYLEAREIPSLWYQCDEGDSDPATFFYYMGLAAQKAAPRRKNPLPLLTPEYLAGISTFTIRYFEKLCGRLIARYASASGRGVAIVLDNYHEVPAGSPFHDMIAAGLDAIPKDVHVVVISRDGPPPALARLHANDKVRLLEYADIRFTLEESNDLVHCRLPKAGDSYVKAICEQMEGWAAGIILMVERARLDGSDTANFRYEQVFDYLAGEIFSKIDKGAQNFLLKTAFLPVLRLPLAEKLAGAGNDGRMLSVLHRSQCFMGRLSGSGQAYRHHPLFRDFLLHRAKATFSSVELAAVQREAALLLEQAGQVEDAARLYIDAGDRDGLSRLAIRHARELLSQGRNRTLEAWIAGISGGPGEDDPWLLYWAGMCSFPADMPRTRRYLERAFALFQATEDTAGIYLSWAGIVDTYAFGLDEWEPLDGWIAIFDNLHRTHPSFPSKEVELIAASRMLFSLTLRKTGRAEWVHEWLERVTALLQEHPSLPIQMDATFFMSVYYLWKGDYHKTAVLLERAEADIGYRQALPLTVIQVKLMKGIHYWVTARYASALRTLSEGLDISASSGVHIFDSLLWSFRAAAEMAPGNLEAAETSMGRQMTALLDKSRTLDTFFYHVNCAWLAILKGNAFLAAEHMETVAAKAAKMGTPYYRALSSIGTALVAFLQGRAGDAKTHIQEAHRISLDIESPVMEWYSLSMGAYFLLQEGKQEEGLLGLRRALSLGSRHGYVHLEFYQPSVMQFLCARALEEGIEPEYVKGLIKRLNLHPPCGKEAEHPAAGNWPYPIKIRTLGRFEILIDEEPLTFPRKVPKKPLELIKTLIAFGSRDVPADKIADVLWPDAEGDAAHSSFKVNLHHLRELLGSDEAILTRDGRISLNGQYCRVDVLEFQSLADRIMTPRAGAGTPEMEEMAPLAERAIGMYKGNFMEGDDGNPYIAILRERLRSRFVRLVEMTGMHYEARRQWHYAVELYEKAIETDVLQEDLYQCLMLCYKQLGRHEKAASAYERCRGMLRTHFGVEPSAGMKALYQTVQPGLRS